MASCIYCTISLNREVLFNDEYLRVFIVKKLNRKERERVMIFCVYVHMKAKIKKKKKIFLFLKQPRF